MNYLYFHMFSRYILFLVDKKNIQKIEQFVFFLAVICMLLHLLVIFLSKHSIIEDEYLSSQSYLQVISTPFTIILVFELFLLVLSVAKSLPISIGKQYEIIVLVLIRDVFKIISSYNFGFNNIIPTDIFLPIFFDIFFAILSFLLVTFYFKIQNSCVHLLEKLESEKSFVEIKSLGSLILTTYFFINLVNYLVKLLNSSNSSEFFQIFKSLDFISDLFILMVIIDVILLLITFNKTHNLKEIFYEANLIISSIIVRFAFLMISPFNGILAVAGISLGFIITFIYSKISKIQI